MKRVRTIFKNIDKNKFKPSKKKVIIGASALVVLVFAISILGGKAKRASKEVVETDFVTRDNIEVTITGSAAVEPFERYEIIPKVSGDIVFCPFDVGDSINEGDLLYGFDTSNSDLTVERQRISLKQSENNYNRALEENDKLYIKAKNDGVISGLSLKVGQEIKAGTMIATVSDTDNLEVVLPFSASQISSIYVGSPATITSSKHMSSVSGTVTHVSSGNMTNSDGTALYNVTISFKNPGVFYSGMSVGGAVGANVSPGSGIIENCAFSTISAETEGTVAKIHHTNGDYVKKGTVIATLTSDSVSDKISDSTLSYQSAKLSMAQTEKDLEDYNITSPISGTVITKNAKAGDTIDKTNSTQTLMVVADISKLKFELSIDELDISKVCEGQSVSITCDALPDEKFEGIITKVSVEGVAQNGVTSYSAEVVINEPGNLHPSMNVDASIIVESANDVLVVPTEDIKTVGRKSYVFVKGNIKADSKKNLAPNGDMPKGDKSKENKPNGKDKDGNQNSQNGFPIPEAPDGFTAIEVETGLANDEYTEIKSGLSEGMEIYKIITTSNSSLRNMMGMGGGSGIPSGGMGGGSGRPSGGMGGSPGGAR